MSKLGSAPPPPPYKVPISERIFGIGKLKPPVTDGVSGQDLLSTIRLGNFSLELESESGQWQMDSRLEQMYRAQITALEEKVAQLEDERLNKNLYELEKKNIALEREKLILIDENNQLKFKNKVLMAMCTISEGDYKALCKEAGIEPRSQKKPIPAPASVPAPTHSQQSQQQPLSSPQSHNPLSTQFPSASPSNQSQPLTTPSQFGGPAQRLAPTPSQSVGANSYPQPSPSQMNQPSLRHQQQPYSTR